MLKLGISAAGAIRRNRLYRRMRLANYVLMELGGRKETEISYTIEAPLRGFYTVGPVCVRVQDARVRRHRNRVARKRRPWPR